MQDGIGAVAAGLLRPRQFASLLGGWRRFRLSRLQPIFMAGERTAKVRLLL